MNDKDKSTQNGSTGAERPQDRLADLGMGLDSTIEAISPAIEQFVSTTGLQSHARDIRLRAYDYMDEDSRHRVFLPPRHTPEGEDFDAAMRRRIGRKVRKARERFGNTKSRTSYGMSRRDLAALAGINGGNHRPSEAGIQHIEDGRTVTATDVIRVAGALGVPVAYLMGPMTLTIEEARRESELIVAYRALSGEDKKAVLRMVRRTKDAFTE